MPRIMHFEKIPSTNEFLKELAKQGAADRCFVSADCQEAGHGQYGRVFESPPGGVYFSMLWKRTAFGDDAADITIAIGEFMRRNVQQLFGVDASVKAPNDLLVNGKKLCGILCESFVSDEVLNVIIGIGLNVNTLPADFSEELQNTVVSIRMLTGKSYDIAEITSALLNDLNEFMNSFGG